jgi:hypothetical protein
MDRDLETDVTGGTPEPSVYATPRDVPSPEGCWFYHAVDVPGWGHYPGEWDLRANVDAYLGNVLLAGKRVLEMGTASGYLCFEIEKRGAEVVAFDLEPGGKVDLVPLASHPDLPGMFAGTSQLLGQLHSSYWFCHKAFRSKAKVVYGRVYELPAAIGTVDVCTFGSILLHLRDPFLALANALRLTRGTVVVTDCLHNLPWEDTLMGRPAPAPPRSRLERAAGRIGRWFGGRPAESPAARPGMIPAMTFLPDPAKPVAENHLNSWWFFTPAVIQRMLGVLGFERTEVSYHRQRYQQKYDLPLFTVVGHRTLPMPANPDGPYPWC